MAVPPSDVRANARKGLELREKWGRGGLSTQEAGRQGIGSGVARARDLAEGNTISDTVIGQMKSFFARNKANFKPYKKESDGGPTAGTIAYYLWGGPAGERWVSSLNNDMKKFQLNVAVTAVDAKLGLVFGWGAISTENGEDYYDVHADHIPETVLLKAVTDFMLNSRQVKEMHEGPSVGTVVFAYPLTKEIQDALEITSERTGLIIAVKPEENVLEKFVTGEYTGFSVGGSIRDFEYVE